MINSACKARVGVLAIALGLGAAVATGQGTAFGETPDSSPGSTDAGTGDDKSAPDPSSAPEPGSEPGGTGSGSTDSAPAPAAEDEDEKDSPSTSTVDLGGGVVVSSSGGAQTSDDDETPEKRSDPAAKVDKDPAPAARPKAKRWNRPEPVAAQTLSESSSAPAAGAAVPSTPKRRTAKAAEAKPSSVPVSTQLTVSAPPAEVQTFASAAPAAQQSVPDKGDVVKTVLSAALAPLFGSGTGDVPVDSPFTWALAAAARRQFEPKPQLLTDANLLRTSEETGEDADSDPAAFAAVALAVDEEPTLVPGGTVGTGQTPSGLAVSGGKAYVTNAAAGTMTVVNLANNSVLATVPVGASPSAVVVNSAGTRAYIANSTANTVTVINTTNNSLVKTIKVGTNPTNLALTPDGSRLLVTNSGSGNVTKINTTTDAVTLNIGVGQGPSSVGFSSDGKFAYVANAGSDSVSVITMSTNGVKTISGVGDSPSDLVVAGPTVYVSNLAGTITRIAALSNTVTGSVAVGAPVKSLALSADGALLLAATTNDKIFAIDVASATVVTSVTTDPTPDTASAPSLAVSAGGTVYQTDSTDNVLRIVTIGSAPSDNQPPEVDEPDVGDPNPQTGVVTGSIVASDPDGDTLTYSVTTAPTYGTVTLGANGSFTYTPTLEGRMLAGDDTEDNFVITVSDGRASVASSVTVEVLPAEPVSGGSISTGDGPSGVAISGGRAYVTNQAAGTMTVINLADNTVVATVPVGASPTAVVVNSAGTRAFVTNRTAGTVTVINTANGSVVKTITVGANPSGLALTPDGTRLFVTNAGSNSVTKVDATTNTVTVGAIGVGQAPSSVAISADGKYAYVTNAGSDSVSVITLSFNGVKTISGVGDSPTDLVIAGNTVYVSNLDGRVTTISAASNTVTGHIVVGAPVSSIAMLPGGALLLAATTDDRVFAIQTAGGTVASVVTTDPTPDLASAPTLAVAADGTIYQTDNTDDVLRKIALGPSVVDVVAPTVAITSPVANATLSGTATVAVTASDNVGVAGVQFRLDSNPLGAEDTASPYSVVFNTALVANGTHTLTAVARDAAGNITTSAPVTFTVANVAPPPTQTSIFFEASPRIGEANGTVMVPIVRTGDLTRTSTIEYGITPDTATAGVDYVGGDGTIMMAVGQDRVLIPVQILNDNLSEPTETFVVSIINVDSGSTLLYPRTARIDILDDENPVVDPPNPPLTSNYDVTREIVVSGLNQPLAFEFAPQDPSLIYVAEKRGVIKVVNIDTGAQKSTFIDISSKVNSVVDRGLMDIALHPHFGEPVQPGQPEHNYVYAFYVVDPPDTVGNPSANAGPDGGGNRFAYLVRFTANAATNYTTAVPGSEVILLGGRAVPGVAELQPRTLQDISGAGAVDSTSAISQPESGFDAQTGKYVDNYIKVDSRSHAGGSLAFGPDGALYVSVGDGTSFNTTDPRTVSVQNINSLSGKILRIDPITGLGLADNPFVEPGDDLSANRSKVYQLGLRNPFSIGFTQDGRLLVSNTGWNSWEEIESGHAGANFGWPYFEGGDNGVILRAPGYQNLASDAARGLPSAAAFYAAVASGAITITPAYRAFAHDENEPGFQVGAIVGVDMVYSGSRYPAEFQNDVFFVDVNDGEVFVVDVNNRSDVKFLYSFWGTPVAFTQGPDGYVYAANLGSNTITRLLITPTQV